MKYFLLFLCCLFTEQIISTPPIPRSKSFPATTEHQARFAKKEIPEMASLVLILRKRRNIQSDQEICEQLTHEKWPSGLLKRGPITKTSGKN